MPYSLLSSRLSGFFRRVASSRTFFAFLFARRTRRFRRVSCGMALACGAGLGLLAAGCADLSSSSALQAPEEEAAADSVFALLERLDDTALRSAFEGLANHAHTQRARTAQFDADGALLASSEREVQYDEEGARAIRSESFGTFDFGYLRRFASSDENMEESALAASGFPEHIILQDPPYASARNREAWRYAFAPDSILSAGPVRVVQITARPGFDASRSIRQVRLYLDRTSDRLEGLYVERTHTALWFREESVFFLSAAPLASGTWVPDRTRFETRVKLLLRPAQRFTSEAEYYDFREMDRVAQTNASDRTD